ncbi:hypothetical protein KEM56_006183 [Ascosphaera pollenicola]|nr:hypothetical protein KEM56_006183 [Ascosphaera pollenicola]
MNNQIHGLKMDTNNQNAPLILKRFQQSADKETEVISIFDGQRRRLKVAGGTFDKATIASLDLWLPTLMHTLCRGNKNWNDALVQKSQKTNNLEVIYIRKSFMGIDDMRHYKIMDLRDFADAQVLSYGMVEASYRPTSTQSPAQASRVSIISCMPEPRRVIIKLALNDSFLNDLQHEANVYNHLQDSGYGYAPRFLGYVHECGKVIGFVLEKLNNVRHPSSPEEFEWCELILKMLHCHGLVHGNPDPTHFLIQGNGPKSVKIVSLWECRYHHNDKKLVKLDLALFHENQTGRGLDLYRKQTAKTFKASRTFSDKYASSSLRHKKEGVSSRTI